MAMHPVLSGCAAVPSLVSGLRLQQLPAALRTFEPRSAGWWIWPRRNLVEGLVCVLSSRLFLPDLSKYARLWAVLRPSFCSMVSRKEEEKVCVPVWVWVWVWVCVSF